MDLPVHILENAVFLEKKVNNSNAPDPCICCHCNRVDILAKIE